MKHKINARIIESKFIVWVLLPVLLALFVSAAVGLQLFKDGSSYLFELLVSHSAVRHDRVSIFLFQSPTITLVKAVNRLQIDALAVLPLERLIFSLNYAVTPLISLLLSWIVLRKKEERLFIWAALIILLVNLVNFSWVSELLISLQVSCPLLLALLQNPRSKTCWTLLLFIAPFIFFLHPLVITIYLTLAVAAAYISYQRAEFNKSARLIMFIFLFAAAFRGLYSLFALSSYEASFLEASEARSYLISSSLEEVLFLVVVIEIAMFVLLSKSIIYSNWPITRMLFWQNSLQSLALLFLTSRFFLRGNLSSVLLAGCFAVTALLNFRYLRDSTPMQKMRLLYISYGVMAGLASVLLLAQYLFYERIFPLKIGLALVAALLIMIVAALDRVRDPEPGELLWRMRLVFACSIIFAFVITGKSLMWQASVDKLEQTLRQTEVLCVERTSADFHWLDNNYYRMIDNWALPSLVLVTQDQQPRKLLLEQNDCRLFLQTGMVQVDPWSLLEKEYIVPPID